MIRRVRHTAVAATAGLYLAVVAFAAHAAQANADLSSDTTDATGRRLSDGCVHLSWNAPHGLPRASENLAPHCASARPDTLWLTFEPGDDARHLYGFDAKLLFHAAPGETLTAYWHFGGGAENPHNVRVEFPAARWPTENPFSTQNYGAAHYDRMPDTGTLDITYAVNADSARAVSGRVCYALARVVFPATDDPATCRRPVCIEWKWALLAVSTQGPNRHGTSMGSARYAGFCAPDGGVCARFRGTRTPRAWKPEGGGP